ncbi:HNH endonuclease signature motif containing protein [Pseudomonas kurunegalensis]|uniref:HNH endonuclease signature motif containing protein n=1 Tax=Pseudomonas TaxID=286 RepID=UPI00211786A4|nr:HNH endonuclease signature motif containing protein [Pseudomonas kurunegalensis]
MLNQERLKTLLTYDPITGEFTWNVSRGLAKAGGPAGSKHHLGYICIGVDGAKLEAHRLAFLYMTGSWPSDDVDHINHIRSDNRWVNLRLATRTENSRNASRYASNSSGVHGVSWKKRDKTWHARICVSGKSIHLGSFKEYDCAVRARRSAEEQYGFHANHGI